MKASEKEIIRRLLISVRTATVAAVDLAVSELDKIEIVKPTVKQEIPTDKCFSIDEAAQRLGLCASSVRKAIADKQIHALQIGRRIVIPYAGLLKAMGQTS